MAIEPSGQEQTLWKIHGERVAWIPLESVRERIAKGEIVGAASQVGLLHVLAFYR